MSNQNQIVTAADAQYTDEQRQLITDVLCKGATNTEVAFFMQVAQRCKLDPFRRQIHAVKRWDSTLKRESLTFQVGIDGFRAIAARTGEYAGNDEPIFEVDQQGNPMKATCTVYRFVHGQRVAFTASCFWREYVQTKRDGSVTSMWSQRPFGQLGKCAEAAALRKAFPEEGSGLYLEEEFDQTEKPAPEPPVTRQTTVLPKKQQQAAVDAETASDASAASGWCQMLPSEWKRVKMPPDSEYDGMTVGQVMMDVQIREKVLGSSYRDGSDVELALDAGQYVVIERILSAIGMTSEDFDQRLRDLGIIESDQELLNCGGELLSEAIKVARDEMTIFNQNREGAQ